MRILLYGINHAPELTGIGKYTGELVAYLAARGDEVEVVTAPPYYPAWEVRPPYRNAYLRERRSGATVLRSPLYVPRRPTGLRRIAHEASFVLSSLRWWLPRLARRYDAILVVNPPFHLGFVALAHRALRGTPVVCHVQDLQVDAARDLGILPDGPVLRLLEGAERWLYARVDALSTISEGMRRRLATKGVPAGDIWLLPNWLDASRVYPLPQNESLRSRWGIPPGDKVVLYAGNLGAKQGLEAIPRLAERFADRPDVHFVVVGEGGTRAELVAEVERRGLVNVRFFPLQPLADLAAMLAAADVHLVLQRRAAADLVMPSKLLNIVAAHGHALVTAEPGTTLHDVVAGQRLGTVVAPEDDGALAEGLERILTGAAAGDTAGLAAGAAAMSREAILPAFRERLVGLSARRRPDRLHPVLAGVALLTVALVIAATRARNSSTALRV